MMTHRFTVGQLVRMNGGFGALPSVTETYRITAVLPPARENSPQYRIRNETERYERMTTEDNLEEI